jgi:hypothetical protein
VRVANTFTKVIGIGGVARKTAVIGRVFQRRSSAFVRHWRGSG